MVSSPPGDVFQIRFSNYFYLSFMLGQVNFRDIAILCLIGQIIVVNKILNVFMSLYFPKGCFHEGATITQLTVQLV